MLQDIAILTGGTVITEELGRKLETVTIEDLGRAGKVVATKDDTTIIEGAGEPAKIKGRIEEIKVEIDKSTSDYDKEKLQERLAKLSGGVAVIRVGAATETELKEKKHRVEDALSATRAAVEEGIVPGGGVALINAREAIKELKLDGEDETIGVNIVRKALEVPMRKITENAGQDGAVVIETVRRKQAEEKNKNIGFDVDQGRVRRHGQGRDHRPGQGDQGRPGERGLDRRHDPDDRGAGDRYAGEGEATAPPPMPEY